MAALATTTAVKRLVVLRCGQRGLKHNGRLNSALLTLYVCLDLHRHLRNVTPPSSLLAGARSHGARAAKLNVIPPPGHLQLPAQSASSLRHQHQVMAAPRPFSFPEPRLRHHHYGQWQEPWTWVDVGRNFQASHLIRVHTLHA